MKRCSTCGMKKAIGKFRKHVGQCKACEAATLKRWRIENPEKVKAQQKRSNDLRRERRQGPYDPNPEIRELFAMQRRNTHLKRKYGISLDDYMVLRDAQGGVCAICGEPPTVAVGQGKHPELVVDHCHGSGRVRGLLCNSCNVAIANARENPDTLRAMIEYLELNAIITDR